MPLNIDFLQVLLHMLNFVILAGGLTFLLFRPVSRFLDERRAYFERAQKENEEKAKENERLKEEYETKLEAAQAEIAAMRAQAEKETARAAQTYIDDAKKKASALLAAAEREAEERKEHILDSAQTEIGELVLSATQKLLGDTVTPERNSGLYDEFIRRAEQTVKDKRNAP
ncbi:MAG: hypothetical protein ACI3XP_03125 [Eubacteriales bacterium]